MPDSVWHHNALTVSSLSPAKNSRMMSKKVATNSPSNEVPFCNLSDYRIPKVSLPALLTRHSVYRMMAVLRLAQTLEAGKHVPEHTVPSPARRS